MQCSIFRNYRPTDLILGKLACVNNSNYLKLDPLCATLLNSNHAIYLKQNSISHTAWLRVWLTRTNTCKYMQHCSTACSITRVASDDLWRLWRQDGGQGGGRGRDQVGGEGGGKTKTAEKSKDPAATTANNGNYFPHEQRHITNFL